MNEFHFVARGQCLMFDHRLRSHSPLPGVFQIHDAMHPPIDLRDIVCPTRFQQYRLSGISQRAHQGKDIFLQ